MQIKYSWLKAIYTVRGVIVTADYKEYKMEGR